MLAMALGPWFFDNGAEEIDPPKWEVTTMMIARWQIDARFGHKQAALDLMRRWNDEFGSQVGWTPDKCRLLTGSVGALESTIQEEIAIKDLAELGESWEQLGKLEGHAEWGKEIEPYIVSGTPHWQIFRVI